MCAHHHGYAVCRVGVLGKVKAHVFVGQGGVRRDVGCEFAWRDGLQNGAGRGRPRRLQKMRFSSRRPRQLRGSDHSLPPVAQLSRLTS